MARFIVAVLLIAFSGLSHGSDPFATVRSNVAAHLRLPRTKITRQDCTSILGGLSAECIAAFSELDSALVQNITDVDTLTAILDNYCQADCIGPFSDYYECEDLPDVTDVYCSEKDDGQYCFFDWLNGEDSILVNVSVCGILGSEDCYVPDPTIDCQNVMQTATDTLGCCLATFLNTNLTHPFVTPDLFAACNVSLVQPCPSPSNAGVVSPSPSPSGAGVVSHVSFEMLTIFVVNAAVLIYLVL